MAYFRIDTRGPYRDEQGSINLGVGLSLGRDVLLTTLLCVNTKLLLPFINCATFLNV